MANKRQLKKISKLFCASIINNIEASWVFENSGLTQEEIDYIDEELKKIAKGFLNEGETTCTNTKDIVEQVLSNKNK